MDGKAASADVNSSSTEKVKPIKDMQGVKEAYPSINEKPAQKPAILYTKWRCLRSQRQYGKMSIQAEVLSTLPPVATV